MSFSFSQPQTSSFLAPNELMDLENLRNAPQVAADVHQNRLLEAQTSQQNITDHDIAMVGQSAAPLLSMSEDDAAKAYPGWLQDMQSRGLAQYAPSSYPGHAATQALVQRAMPILQQIQTGFFTPPGSAAAIDKLNQIYTGSGTTTGSTPTIGGADTAPINAAGDSRTRKAAEGGPPAAGSPGAAVAQRTHDFWISKGFSEEQTAGIMAGGPGSESNFIPTASGDGGTSIGLYQHHGPRLHNAQGTGLFDRYGPNPTADQQNEYAHWEITQGPLKNVGEMLKTAKTPAEAAAIWTQYFGVPADKTEIGRRAAGAQRFVGLYGQPQQGGPGGATAAATPPGVQMGGVPPPPPGGSTAPYTGGGMGAVLAPGGPGGRRLTQAERLGGTEVAGPPMVASTNPTAAVPATDPLATPARYAGTAPAPSAEVPPETGWGSQVGSGYGPQNALAQAAVPASQQPPAPAQQQPAPTPATRANLPRAADVPQGASSPQIQQAQDLMHRAAQIEMVAAQNPYDKRLQADAAAKAADLKQRAQILMQTDSVVQTQEGQLHTLTGKLDESAKPLADYHETSPGSGIWVGGPGTDPKFQPPGRLIIDKAGDVWRTTTGGAEKLSRLDPAAVAALNEAAAAGTATGTATAKQLPDLMLQARNAAAQEGQIDYATNQLREAAKGGVPSGYFSQGLATAAAAAKSLGLDGALRAVGVNPEAVGNIQTAQKTLSVIGGAILRQALGAGSAITDAKIEAFIHTQPGIETDPQALQRIMAWARSQYTYERELGHAAVSEAAKPENAGRLPPHWLPAYYRDHGFAPIYDPGTQEMRQPDGTQPQRETPPVQPSQATQLPALPPAAAAKLKEGVNTHFGNGQTWTRQNGKPVQVQ